MSIPQLRQARLARLVLLMGEQYLEVQLVLLRNKLLQYTTFSGALEAQASLAL